MHGTQKKELIRDCGERVLAWCQGDMSSNLVWDNAEWLCTSHLSLFVPISSSVKWAGEGSSPWFPYPCQENAKWDQKEWETTERTEQQHSDTNRVIPIHCMDFHHKVATVQFYELATQSVIFSLSFLGHEYPYAIKLSCLEVTSFLTQESKDSASTLDLQESFFVEQLPWQMQCQFILKQSQPLTGKWLPLTGPLFSTTYAKLRTVIQLWYLLNFEVRDKGEQMLAGWGAFSLRLLFLHTAMRKGEISWNYHIS